MRIGMRVLIRFLVNIIISVFTAARLNLCFSIHTLVCNMQTAVLRLLRVSCDDHKGNVVRVSYHAAAIR